MSMNLKLYITVLKDHVYASGFPILESIRSMNQYLQQCQYDGKVAAKISNQTDTSSLKLRATPSSETEVASTGTDWSRGSISISSAGGV